MQYGNTVKVGCRIVLCIKGKHPIRRFSSTEALISEFAISKSQNIYTEKLVLFMSNSAMPNKFMPDFAHICKELLRPEVLC